MINIIYKKKEVVISAGIGFDKNLLYQLIPFIREKAIILLVLSIIIHMTDQVYLSIIIF